MGGEEEFGLYGSEPDSYSYSLMRGLHQRETYLSA